MTSLNTSSSSSLALFNLLSNHQLIIHTQYLTLPFNFLCTKWRGGNALFRRNWAGKTKRRPRSLSRIITLEDESQLELVPTDSRRFQQSKENNREGDRHADPWARVDQMIAKWRQKGSPVRLGLKPRSYLARLI